MGKGKTIEVGIDEIVDLLSIERESISELEQPLFGVRLVPTELRIRSQEQMKKISHEPEPEVLKRIRREGEP